MPKILRVCTKIFCRDIYERFWKQKRCQPAILIFAFFMVLKDE